MPHPFRSLVFLLWASSAVAQGTGVVAGTITDSATRAPMQGASVSVVGTTIAASASESGRFRLARVSAGTITVSVRAPGYTPVTRTVVVRNAEVASLDVALSRMPTLLGAVRADAAPDDRLRFETRPEVGAITLSAEALKAVPKLGEADPVRVLQFLPAVQSKNDFSSGFSVRGGESSQNLVLLDGYPLYNPFHLGGVFSTFIDAAVRDVQLRTGSIPAQYGGRLSSVLDVRSVNEARVGIHGSGEVSALAATGTLSGASADARLGWTLSARRTYADQLVQVLSDERMPYWFHDLQGRISHTFANGARLSVTAYTGRDVLDGSYSSFESDSRPGAEGGEFFYGWGNSLLGVTLDRPIGWRPRFLGGAAISALTASQSVSVSTFSSKLNLGGGASRYTNHLRDFRATGMLVAQTPNQERTIGYEVASHLVEYQVDEGAGSINTSAGSRSPNVAALFAENVWRASPAFLLSGGLRVESMPSAGWIAVSPRLNVRRFLGGSSAITISAGRLTQWMHSLSVEDNPIRLFDAWRVSEERDGLASAWQLMGGYERWFGELRQLRVELFHKTYDRILEPDVEANALVRTDVFVPITGQSYGADVLLRQVESGPFSGWVAYTFSVSERTRDTVTYAPSQDRRHDVNVVASWRIGATTLGARVGYGSGLPYTDIVGSLPRRRWDPATNSFGGSGSRVRFEALGANRNGARFPSTRRIDLYAERRFQLRAATMTAYASVINAANTENVLYYTYDYLTGPPTRRGVSQLPVIPTLGVRVAF